MKKKEKTNATTAPEGTKPVNIVDEGGVRVECLQYSHTFGVEIHIRIHNACHFTRREENE